MSKQCKFVTESSPPSRWLHDILTKKVHEAELQCWLSQGALYVPRHIYFYHCPILWHTFWMRRVHYTSDVTGWHLQFSRQWLVRDSVLLWICAFRRSVLPPSSGQMCSLCRVGKGGVQCRERRKKASLWEMFIWIAKWWEVTGWGESVSTVSVEKLPETINSSSLVILCCIDCHFLHCC
jgi:hypothetical protein